MAHFPLFLSLEGKECLVLGAGKVARRKSRVLLEYGAKITICAIKWEPELEELIKEYGREKVRFLLLTLTEGEQWKQELKSAIQPHSIEGFFLVICGTNQMKLNEEVALFYQERNILVNVANSPNLCTFFFPAVVKKGPVSIGISTSGMSPFVSKILRREIEQIISDELVSCIEEINEYRKKIKKEVKEEEERTLFIKQKVLDCLQGKI